MLGEPLLVGPCGRATGLSITLARDPNLNVLDILVNGPTLLECRLLILPFLQEEFDKQLLVHSLFVAVLEIIRVYASA